MSQRRFDLLCVQCELCSVEHTRQRPLRGSCRQQGHVRPTSGKAASLGAAWGWKASAQWFSGRFLMNIFKKTLF